MINSQSKFESKYTRVIVVRQLQVILRLFQSETFHSFEIVLYFHEYWHRIIDTGLQRLLKVKFGGDGNKEMYVITLALAFCSFEHNRSVAFR